jgi:hypothetical protein
METSSSIVVVNNDSFSYTDEVFDWLFSYGAQGWRPHIYEKVCYSKCKYNTLLYHSIWFKDPDVAMLFKLTFL